MPSSIFNAVSLENTIVIELTEWNFSFSLVSELALPLSHLIKLSYVVREDGRVSCCWEK